MSTIALSEEEHQLLSTIARDSIQNGLQNHHPLPITLAEVSPPLKKKAATFVTLTLNSTLRGCIGSVVATQPLITDIANNAFNAAFNDPRFSPITAQDLPELSIQISILSTTSKIAHQDEQDLINTITPHVDGIILKDQGRSSTFLPAVWEQLPDPSDFIAHLKLKAGFSQDYWSETLEVYRYSVESWHE